MEKLNVSYVGYSEPSTSDEVELEMLGLQLAIKKAEMRLMTLQQGLRAAQVKLKSAMQENAAKENDSGKTV